MITKLRYVDSFSLSISSGSLAKQLMRWNSTFDPDFTGVGHQPLYRDTFASVYDHYAVVSTKAKVKYINTSTDTVIVCGVVTEDDSSSSSTSTTLCEQATGQHTILPPLAGSLSTHTFAASWDCQEVLGIDPYGSEAYKTPTGENPSEESYLVIWVTNYNASTMAVTVNLEMEFTVVWSELATPTQS
jgi:hypothetical protein